MHLWAMIIYTKNSIGPFTFIAEFVSIPPTVARNPSPEYLAEVYHYI